MSVSIHVCVPYMVMMVFVFPPPPQNKGRKTEMVGSDGGADGGGEGEGLATILRFSSSLTFERLAIYCRYMYKILKRGGRGWFEPKHTNKLHTKTTTTFIGTKLILNLPSAKK